MNKQKGVMARKMVMCCFCVLIITAVWSMVLKTIGIFYDRTIDLSDVLVFIGAAFGGELLMLLLKRIFAKDSNNNEEE